MRNICKFAVLAPDCRISVLCCADMLQKKGAAKLRKELLVGFDPVSMLVDQLQQRFHGAASFFVDVMGGHAIGIKWSSKAFEATMFDVKMSHCLEPVDGRVFAHDLQMCTLSVSAMLADVKTLGAGLIQQVSLLIH